jgi:hypothetical protein
MLNVSTFGNTADIYAIVHILPHTCQYITVDQSHSRGDKVAKILEISGEWRHKDVQGYLNRNLPQRWIGRTGREVDALMRWPPRSPDLTPCDFFLTCICLRRHVFRVTLAVSRAVPHFS